MAFNLKNVSTHTVDRPPRIVLGGTPKIGKTTFASQFPKPFLIPIKGEEGADQVVVSCYRDESGIPIAITSWEMLIESIVPLFDQEHDYQTLIIDSVSTLEPIIWDQVCSDHNAKSIEKVGGGFGKGYIEALGYWRQLTECLDDLRSIRGMGCILIGHVIVKQFSDPLTDPYDQYILSINSKAAELLYRWCDVSLFANRKVYTREVKGGKTRGTLIEERKLYTQARPAHPGGGRGVYGRLEYEIDLSYESFQAAIQAAGGK